MDNGEIARATLHYIDEHGLDAVSFRRVGEAIGVPTMTVCNRFKSKDGLLRAALGAMLDEVPVVPVEGESWAGSLARVARLTRGMALAHPRAFPLFVQVPPFEPPVSGYTRRVFATHTGQGVPERLPFAFLSVMHSFVSGFQTAEAHARLALEEGGPGPEAAEFAHMFDGDAFERDLLVILRGLAVTYGLELDENEVVQGTGASREGWVGDDWAAG